MSDKHFNVVSRDKLPAEIVTPGGMETYLERMLMDGWQLVTAVGPMLVFRRIGSTGSLVDADIPDPWRT